MVLVKTCGLDSKEIAVSPSSVRVWRGFRAAHVSSERFRDKLGEVFIPATVQIMGGMGLTAYLPSVLPDTPMNIPNEIAIVFYKTEKAYYKTFDTTAGRSYGLLHQAIFDKNRSKSGFPKYFDDSFDLDQPYFLINTNIDWYHGVTQVYVGSRELSHDVESYKDKVFKVIKTIKNMSDDQRDGVIVCVSQDYLVYWEHWCDKAGMNKRAIDELKKVTTDTYDKASFNIVISAEFSAPYEGMKLKGDDCLNVQFNR